MPTNYVSREVSENIKGILILLIVFGHNHVLCPNTEVHGIVEYLYMFHVVGFFILPFFYKPKNEISKNYMLSLIVRCFIPYFWICILCLLCNCIYTHECNIGICTLLAFIQGTQTPIREYFGFVFPWFLPTYCSFSLMLLLSRNHKYITFLLVLLSVWTWSMDWNTFYWFKNDMPLGLGLAISYFGFGYFAFFVNTLSKCAKYLSVVIFVLLSIAYWKCIDLYFLYKLFPMVFFLSIIAIVPLVKCHFLRLLGQNSIGIYLFHMFFVNITYILLPQTPIWGWIEFIFSLLGSLLLAIVITKQDRFRKILFPKTLNDVISSLNC